MLTRRACLSLLPVATLLGAKTAKPLTGIFPILQTPFTRDNKLDTKALAAQVRFCDKAGAHGVVWPQLASEYSDLTMDERMAGMEVVAQAGSSGKCAVVLGVQGADLATALQYVKYAEKLGPDAIIALPPKDASDRQKVLAYYKAIGDSATRPLFAQTIGDMPVEFVMHMASAIPNFRYVKDEAGHTLARLSEYRRKNHDVIKGVFTGGHGKTLIDEMMRGSAGTMPAAGFVDLYRKVWDAWQAGDRTAAMEHFSKVMLLVTQVTTYGIPSLKYILEVRGVFENSICRSGSRGAHFDDEAKKAIRETMAFLKIA